MEETWVVVADSARARIFSLQPRKPQLREVHEILHPQSRSHVVQNGAEPGSSSFGSEPPDRLARNERISPKQHEAWKLGKELADKIESGRTQGHFKRLVLVAPPAFLGELRKRISASAARLVTEEITKEIVALEPHEIRKHLPDSLWN